MTLDLRWAQTRLIFRISDCQSSCTHIRDRSSSRSSDNSLSAKIYKRNKFFNWTKWLLSSILAFTKFFILSDFTKYGVIKFRAGARIVSSSLHGVICDWSAQSFRRYVSTLVAQSFSHGLLNRWLDCATPMISLLQFIQLCLLHSLVDPRSKVHALCTKNACHIAELSETMGLAKVVDNIIPAPRQQLSIFKDAPPVRVDLPSSKDLWTTTWLKQSVSLLSIPWLRVKDSRSLFFSRIFQYHLISNFLNDNGYIC